MESSDAILHMTLEGRQNQTLYERVVSEEGVINI